MFGNPPIRMMGGFLCKNIFISKKYFQFQKIVIQLTKNKCSIYSEGRQKMGTGMICNCKQVSYADVDKALHQMDKFDEISESMKR